MEDNKTRLDWKIFFAGNGLVVFEPTDPPVSVFPHDSDGGTKSVFERFGRQMLSAISVCYDGNYPGYRIKVEIEPIDKELEYGE